MQSYPPIDLDQLALSIQWVSVDGFGDNVAYVSRERGTIHRVCEENDELPEDIEDGSLYLAMPHQRDLDLGSLAVFKFARRELTDDQEDRVREIFQRRGAFGRFKDYVTRIGQLEAWCAFRAQAEKHALREWCEENGLLPPAPTDNDEA